MSPADVTSTLDLVVLDRDGVINAESPEFIKAPIEWRPLPGALEAIVRLQRDFEVVVATNQSGVGRGLLTLETLDAIHTEMNRRLVAAGGRAVTVLFCPHLPEQGCGCRKPAPGLLETAFAMYGCAPGRAVFIGDSQRDLLAAEAAGCRPVLVRTGHGLRAAQTEAGARAEIFDDLAAAVAGLQRLG